MKRWSLIVGKEIREMLSNYKVLWLPLAFMLLAVQQPISTYYLPELLELAGGLPEGTVLAFPVPQPEQVMVEVMGQLQMLGIAILVMGFMGSVAYEIASGSAGLILLRPVSLAAYVIGKWSAAVLLMWLALLLAWTGSAYYTGVLFGKLPIAALLSSMLVYGIWLMFILALLLFAGCVCKSAVGTAAMTVGAAVLLSVSNSLLIRNMAWNPAKLSDHAAAFLLDGNWPEGLGLTLLAASLFMALLLGMGVVALKRREVLL